MATIPPNNETPTGQDWHHPTPRIVGADNPWQAAEEQGTQESLPTGAAAAPAEEEIGEWTRWSRENPLQSEPPPPTQSQYWAEEPSSSNWDQRASEFDPVQGPFPEWRGFPPTPWKNREEDFVPQPVGFERCPTCSRFIRGGRWALRQHQLSSSGCIAARTGAPARQPCYLCGKMLAAGDHWARTQHSRFCPGSRRPEQGPPAHPTTRLDGDDDWDNSPNHRQDHWNERQEPVNNSSSYQDSGAWRWDNERQDHYSDESYCHSEWANAAARLRRWRQNESWDNSEWTTSWQDERQHGWQGHQRWYENDNERDDSNHANDYHQPNSNRWRHEDPETQDSNNSDRWHQEYQNNSAWEDQEADYHHRWRQAGTGSDGYWESNSGTQRHPESTHQDDSWQSTQWWQNGHHRGWWDSSAQ